MDLKEILTTHREYLHQIPELGFCEFKTSAYLKDFENDVIDDANEKLLMEPIPIYKSTNNLNRLVI